MRLSLILLLCTFFLKQDVFEVSNPCEFLVTGTSNLHNWQMRCNNVKGRGTVYLENKKIKSISSMEINLLAENLKSDERLLEKNAHQSLKSDLYPSINFILSKVKEIKYNEDKCLISALGFITIAGTKRSTSLEVKATVKDEAIIFEGESNFKLSDFNIDPPELLFGSLRTGNEIHVKFNVKFRPNTQNIKSG